MACETTTMDGLKNKTKTHFVSHWWNKTQTNHTSSLYCYWL